MTVQAIYISTCSADGWKGQTLQLRALEIFAILSNQYCTPIQGVYIPWARFDSAARDLSEILSDSTNDEHPSQPCRQSLRASCCESSTKSRGQRRRASARDNTDFRSRVCCVSDQVVHEFPIAAALTCSKSRGSDLCG